MVGERVRESLRALAELGQVGFLFLWLEQDIHLSALMAAPCLWGGPELFWAYAWAPSSCLLCQPVGRGRKMAPLPEEGLRSAGLLFMVAEDGGRAVSLPGVCVCGGALAASGTRRTTHTVELGTVTHHRAPGCSRSSLSLLLCDVQIQLTLLP